LETLKSIAKKKADELNALEQAAKQAANAVDEQVRVINQEKATLSALPPLIDASGFQEKIQQGNESNSKADRWDLWSKQNGALIELRQSYKVKDEEVKALDKAKKEALESAVWPLEGLSVEDGVILFNGSQLAQCGHSEQMLVCGALAAETIKEHKLHVVRMDGIESMSKKDFDRLESIFNDKGIQVLSSRVTRGDVDDGEILIVDGEIK
jgi:hypothetical protein